MASSTPVVFSEKDMETILNCVTFAAWKHRFQKRKSPDAPSYIVHPLGVGKLIWQVGGVRDLAVIMGGILHDTVEDTETTLDEIESLYGKEVRDIVNDVSDDKSLDGPTRKLKQIEHAPHILPKAKIVKMADKLYNLTDLTRSVPVGWTVERVQEYFRWGWKVIAGLRGANAGLEKAIDELFETATFTIDGQTYKAFPSRPE